METSPPARLCFRSRQLAFCRAENKRPSNGLGKLVSDPAHPAWSPQQRVQPCRQRRALTEPVQPRCATGLDAARSALMHPHFASAPWTLASVSVSQAAGRLPKLKQQQRRWHLQRQPHETRPSFVERSSASRRLGPSVLTRLPPIAAAGAERLALHRWLSWAWWSLWSSSCNTLSPF